LGEQVFEILEHVDVVQDPLGAVIAENGMIVNEPEYSHFCRIVSKKIKAKSQAPQKDPVFELKIV